MLMEFVVSGVRLYGDKPWTFTRCEESVKGYQIVVGGFVTDGLLVNFSDGDYDFIGVGPLRKF